MKKFSLKSIAIGLISGIAGTTAVLTVFATSSINSAVFSDAKVYLYGQEVSLENQLALIVKDGETDARLYMPVRELLEYMNFIVEWDGVANSVSLTSNDFVAAQNNNTDDRDVVTQNNNIDDRALLIIQSTGTWGPEIDMLIPQMTPKVVDEIVLIYLERQLFPGISTPTNAKTVTERLETAFRYMTENGRQEAERILSAYY